MRVELPVDVKTIIETLEANGYEAFAVGGCVRDTLLLRVPGDWDITTSAKPEEVKTLFSHTIDTGIQHGTVTVMKNHVGYEVTTYRIDGEYEDARHPKEVIFTANLVEDLKRRDFTINAMAYNNRAGIVDEFDGIKDLEEKVIRCVGEPRERFSEDALRMLRAVRFAAQLGFSIDEKTKEAIKELAPTLAKVSKERIAVELIKILVSDHPEEIRTAYELGLTSVFMPEFDIAMQTIGMHSIVAMRHVQAEKRIRLSMLLHELGADKAKEILKRLKFDNATIDFVYRMVNHLDDRPPMDNMALVRKCISEIGLENMPMMIEMKRADILAQSDDLFEEKMGYVDGLEHAYQEVVAKNYCVDKKNLSVNGRDLIEMGMKPGEGMGVVLDMLFNEVLRDPTQNDREKLLERANKLITPFI
ncbi:MAG: CCA tRNA nucleotidyltransferase [Agathobacter sp.]|nr:CCA tRNA nucleotidyltransferase [Agathobacter sp.]